ncbi:hypothetical protein, partial [Escherichia coli]
TNSRLMATYGGQFTLTLKLLEAKGQKVALNEAMGSTQSIMVGSDGELYGASDSRLVDDLTAGY